MVDPASWPRLLEVTVLLVPAAVLASLIALLLTSRRRRRRQAADNANERTIHSAAHFGDFTPTSVAADQLANSGSAAPSDSLKSQPSEDSHGRKTASQMAGETYEVSLDDLIKQLADAEARGANEALAPLHLRIANQHRTHDDQAAAIESIRLAAGFAAMHGQHAIHAVARLELAELAVQNADMTTACEHWQMARLALEADGQRDEHDRVERRMKAAGCPTDWVLTDF